MYYLVVGVVTLWDGIRSGQRSGVVLGWILLGAMGWVKNEGTLLFALLAAVALAPTPLRLRLLVRPSPRPSHGPSDAWPGPALSYSAPHDRKTESTDLGAARRGLVYRASGQFRTLRLTIVSLRVRGLRPGGVPGVSWVLAAVVTCALAFGWRGGVAWAGIPTADFALVWRPESWEWIDQALHTAWTEVALDPQRTGGLLWVFAAAMVLFPCRMLGSPGARRLLAVFILYTAAVTLMYGFSTLMEHQPYYHLLAVSRVLVVPVALVPVTGLCKPPAR